MLFGARRQSSEGDGKSTVDAAQEWATQRNPLGARFRAHSRADHHVIRDRLLNGTRSTIEHSPSFASTRAGFEPRLVNDRLEQLDGVARRVVDQDLLATDTGDDLVAELRAGCAQGRHERLEIGHFDREAVPAAWFWPAAIGHRLRPTAWRTRATWRTEHKAQITP